MHDVVNIEQSNQHWARTLDHAHQTPTAGWDIDRTLHKVQDTPWSRRSSSAGETKCRRRYMDDRSRILRCHVRAFKVATTESYEARLGSQQGIRDELTARLEPR